MSGKRTLRGSFLLRKREKRACLHRLSFRTAPKGKLCVCIIGLLECGLFVRKSSFALFLQTRADKIADSGHNDRPDGCARRFRQNIAQTGTLHLLTENTDQSAQDIADSRRPDRSAGTHGASCRRSSHRPGSISSSSSSGSSNNAFILRLILPSLIPITFTCTSSPVLRTSAGDLILFSQICDTCTRPDSPFSKRINAP